MPRLPKVAASAAGSGLEQVPVRLREQLPCRLRQVVVPAGHGPQEGGRPWNLGISGLSRTASKR